MKKLLIIPIIISLVGCSTIRNPTLKEAAILDTVTTKIAINNGFVEANPIGFTAATIIKVVVVNQTNKLEDSQKKEKIESIGSSIWTGASLNNTLLVLGASPTFSIISGIILGIMIYMNPQKSNIPSEN